MAWVARSFGRIVRWEERAHRLIVEFPSEVGARTDQARPCHGGACVHGIKPASDVRIGRKRIVGTGKREGRPVDPAPRGDIGDAVVIAHDLQDQQTALEAQQQAVADAARHARNRYRAGYSPYIEQVDAQRALLGVELSLIQVQADELTTLVGLYQAVGGAPE